MVNNAVLVIGMADDEENDVFGLECSEEDDDDGDGDEKERLDAYRADELINVNGYKSIEKEERMEKWSRLCHVFRFLFLFCFFFNVSFVRFVEDM